MLASSALQMSLPTAAADVHSQANESGSDYLSRQGSVTRTNAIAKLKRAASQREMRSKPPLPAVQPIPQADLSSEDNNLSFQSSQEASYTRTWNPADEILDVAQPLGDHDHADSQAAAPQLQQQPEVTRIRLPAFLDLTAAAPSAFLSPTDFQSPAKISPNMDTIALEIGNDSAVTLNVPWDRSPHARARDRAVARSPLPSLEQLRARILHEREAAGLQRSVSTSAASQAARAYALEKLLGNDSSDRFYDHSREGTLIGRGAATPSPSPPANMGVDYDIDEGMESDTPLPRPSLRDRAQLRRSRTIGGLSAMAEAQRKAAFVEGVFLAVPGASARSNRLSRLSRARQQMVTSSPSTDQGLKSEQAASGGASVAPAAAASAPTFPDEDTPLVGSNFGVDMDRSLSQRQIARTEMMRKLSNRGRPPPKKAKVSALTPQQLTIPPPISPDSSLNASPTAEEATLTESALMLRLSAESPSMASHEKQLDARKADVPTSVSQQPIVMAPVSMDIGRSTASFPAEAAMAGSASIHFLSADLSSPLEMEEGFIPIGLVLRPLSSPAPAALTPNGISPTSDQASPSGRASPGDRAYPGHRISPVPLSSIDSRDEEKVVEQYEERKKEVVDSPDSAAFGTHRFSSTYTLASHIQSFQDSPQPDAWEPDNSVDNHTIHVATRAFIDPSIRDRRDRNRESAMARLTGEISLALAPSTSSNSSSMTTPPMRESSADGHSVNSSSMHGFLFNVNSPDDSASRAQRSFPSAGLIRTPSSASDRFGTQLHANLQDGRADADTSGSTADHAATSSLAPATAAMIHRYSRMLTATDAPALVPGVSPDASQDPPRKLVMADPVFQVISATTIKDRYLFLFSDVLVIAKPISPPAGDTGMASWTKMKDAAVLPDNRWNFAVKNILELHRLKVTVMASSKTAAAKSRSGNPVLWSFVEHFSHNPDEAVKTLVSKMKLQNSLTTVAQLLHQTPELDRTQLTYYITHLSRRKMLEAYIAQHRLSGVSIESGLRSLLLDLRFPLDVESFEALLVFFAKRWVACNGPLIKAEFTPELGSDLVFAVMALNDALHSVMPTSLASPVYANTPHPRNAVTPGFFSAPCHDLSKTDFIQVFRQHDPHGILSDRTLGRIYLSVRSEPIAQALDTGEPRHTIRVKGGKLPTRLVYGQASDPITLCIDRPDADLAIRLYAQDSTFDPPILTFGKSREATFIITSKSLGQKQIVFVRAGRNARFYSGTELDDRKKGLPATEDLPLPRSANVTVERAFMKHSFTLTSRDDERRFMFSFENGEKMQHWVKAIGKAGEESLASKKRAVQESFGGVNPLARKAAQAIALQVLRDTLVFLDDQDRSMINRPATVISSSFNRSATTALQAPAPAILDRQQSTSRHYYAAQGAGRFERDLQKGHTKNAASLSSRTPADSKHLNGGSIITICKQNSLLPLVLSHLKKA